MVKIKFESHNALGCSNNSIAEKQTIIQCLIPKPSILLSSSFPEIARFVTEFIHYLLKDMFAHRKKRILRLLLRYFFRIIIQEEEIIAAAKI